MIAKKNANNNRTSRLRGEKNIHPSHLRCDAYRKAKFLFVMCNSYSESALDICDLGNPDNFNFRFHALSVSDRPKNRDRLSHGCV